MSYQQRIDRACELIANRTLTVSEAMELLKQLKVEVTNEVAARLILASYTN